MPKILPLNFVRKANSLFHVFLMSLKLGITTGEKFKSVKHNFSDETIVYSKRAKILRAEKWVTFQSFALYFYQIY